VAPSEAAELAASQPDHLGTLEIDERFSLVLLLVTGPMPESSIQLLDQTRVLLREQAQGDGLTLSPEYRAAAIYESRSTGSGLSLWACGDQVGPPPDGTLADGTLAVSTSTVGDDPDPDGFQLRIDGIDSLALLPSGTAELELSPGRHTLQLLGVADHCSVASGPSLDVDIVAGRRAPVAFQVSCPGTSIHVTVTTTGPNPDQDGYQLRIDGADAHF
jgi:hypothetical protein